MMVKQVVINPSHCYYSRDNKWVYQGAIAHREIQVILKRINQGEWVVITAYQPGILPRLPRRRRHRHRHRRFGR